MVEIRREELVILLHVIKDFGDQEEERRRKKRKEKCLGLGKTLFDDVWVWGKP